MSSVTGWPSRLAKDFALAGVATAINLAVARLLVRAGRIHRSIVPVISNDYFATLVDIAGGKPHPTDGESLVPLLKRKGKLFHYTGTPNRLTSGRDVPNEVAKRLQRAGFDLIPDVIGDLFEERAEVVFVEAQTGRHTGIDQF